MEFSGILRLVESGGFLRCRVDIYRNIIFIEFSGILRLEESSGLLRRRVDISRNLRLVDLSRSSRF